MPFDPNQPFEEIEGEFDPNAPFEDVTEQFNKTMKGGIESVKSGVGTVASTIGKGLDFIDQYNPAGAALRGGLAAAQEGKPFLEAYGKQYGEPGAPTGSQIAQKAGVPNPRIMSTPDSPFSPGMNIGLADLVGGAGEMALDPTTYLGGVGGAKSVAKGARMVEGVGQAAIRGADRQAAKSAIGNSQKYFNEMSRSPRSGVVNIQKADEALREAGRTLRTADEAGEAVVSPFSNAVTIGEKAEDKRQFFGKKIGETGSKIDDAFPVQPYKKIEDVFGSVDTKTPGGAISGDKIAKDIRSYVESIPQTDGNSALREKLLREADLRESLGNMSFASAQDLKGQFKFNPQDGTTLVGNKDAASKIREIISKNMDEAVEAHGSAEELAKYQLYKNLYGKYKLSAEASGARAGRDFKNRMISPSSHAMGMGAIATDMAMGTGGAATAAKAAAAAGANQFLLQRGNSALSGLLGSIGNKLEAAGGLGEKYKRVFNAAGAATPEALILKHKLLMQSDPEYRKIISGNQEQQP